MHVYTIYCSNTYGVIGISYNVVFRYQSSPMKLVMRLDFGTNSLDQTATLTSIFSQIILRMVKPIIS